MSEDIRWKQRLQNFSKALALLREPFAREAGSLSDLEKEGIVQRFEITFELGWKTLKDYLVFNGVAFQQITPRNVIKEGFSSKMIADGQLWIDMLDRRNLLAHIYDESLLDETVSLIATKFLPAFGQLFDLLVGKST
jgi:nucleotidyltransferase substrate binding protein (TIGR01987 family)